MHPLAGRTAVKMNGIGNAIVVLDLRGTAKAVDAAAARAIHRAPGLAYDQLMAISDARTPDTAAFVSIFNNDGTESGACGNGTRCVAAELGRQGAPTRLVVETAAGKLACKRLGPDRYSVDMGSPRLRWDEIPLAEPFADTRGIELQIGPIDAPVLHTPAVANMGNPHAVFFVDDVEAYDLARLGPLLENHPIFPERANISLAHVEARDRIRLRVWERGVGLTLACGSAACAALVSAARRGLSERRALVALPGGELDIFWDANDHVIMAGAVEFEFDAVLDAALFENVAA
jgi:diaminopimelate epimerase